MHYQLKAQQLLTYSRIRMYRTFLERLAADPNVRTNGESHLFYFMMLCSMPISAHQESSLTAFVIPSHPANGSCP